MREAGRNEARREIAARGLTPAAVAHLASDALGTIGLGALPPIKRLLKRFFSDEPWAATDDDALAQLAGSGDGWWRHELDQDLAVEFGWRDSAFRLEAALRHTPDETFAGPVVPEATPNPRTIRFVTPPIHDGPSRWFATAVGVDDPRVARLFAEFDDVANVLVGPGFVAVGLGRPDRWEQLLDPVLRAITTEFATSTPGPDPISSVDDETRDETSRPRSASADDGGSALERAWKELGSLRADEPADLERVLAAVASPTRAARQVAARLLVDADAEVAAREWGRLVGDPSRSVRRATVDAMVDAARPALRGLLERALRDTDAWTRWKAVRGLVDLGAEPSRAAVTPLTQDPDFRVRLEAAGALGGPPT